MAINNLNPRRTVWFSPREPLNKYDIWLSKNAHLDESGEPTTDSNAQRDCDYIFKIYDCGKWLPIVGFNSTARYKINIVDGVNYTYTISNTSTSHTNNGFQQNHLPLFRNPEDSPDELFDAGTLGEALYGFVSEQEWNTLFNVNWFQSAFNTSIIGGNNYNWSTLINNLISNGDVLIPFADENTCGGIYSATHTYDALSAFKPIEVKFYPTTSTYSSKLHRLCVSASDVILQINSYYNDNPSGQSLNIPLATTSTIGGIKSDVHSYGVTSAFKPVECKFYPNQGTWSSLHERLCINADDVIDSFIDSFDSEYPLLIGDNGITLSLTPDHSQITWEVSNLRYAEAGKYARSLVVDGNHTIEWADLPEGIEYSEGYGIIISQENEISLNIELIEEETPPNVLTVSWTDSRDTINISGLDYSKSVGLYEYYENISLATDYTFSLISSGALFSNTNPIYLRIFVKSITLENGTKYIGNISGNGEYLVTIQFGVIKFEEIKEYNNV